MSSFGEGPFGHGSYPQKVTEPREWPLFGYIIIVVFLVAFATAAIVVTTLKAVPEQSAATPAELRNMSRACVKHEGGHPVITTIYNKPAGEPGRQPVRWILKCRK